MSGVAQPCDELALSLEVLAQLADTTKKQGCAFLHCGLDETCGREVVPLAKKIGPHAGAG